MEEEKLMTISITKMVPGKNKYLLRMPTDEAQKFKEFFELFSGSDKSKDWYTYDKPDSRFYFDRRLLPTVWLLIARHFPGRNRIADEYAEFHSELKKQQDVMKCTP